MSVYRWIKSYGKALEALKSEQKIEVVEMDEMHTYIGHKKTTAGFGYLLIGMEKGLSTAYLGNRGTQTGKRLWEELKKKEISQVMTDYWKVYPRVLPEQKHVQSKAETFTVEGYNSLFRHFLARLRRKTKCYTKSLEMLMVSVKLLMLKRNNQLTILK